MENWWTDIRHQEWKQGNETYLPKGETSPSVKDDRILSRLFSSEISLSKVNPGLYPLQ